MAKMRYINTRFWDDSYIRNLKPEAKLIFLYLITNALTELCGAYEIGLDRIAFDTGINPKTISSSLSQFERAGKMLYRDGWIYIKNFAKHQHSNPSIQAGIKSSFDALPENIRTQITEWTDCGQTVDRLEQDVTYREDLIQRRSNRESDIDATQLTPKQQNKKFFEDQALQEELVQWLVAKGTPETIVRSEMTRFISHWTELTPDGKKQLWETKPTFEVKLRLGTWFSNMGKFGSYKPKEKKGIIIS